MIKKLRKHITFLLFIIFSFLLIMIYFSLEDKNNRFKCTEDRIWQRKLVLDHMEKFTIRWNVTNNQITFMMTGKTLGWLGLGFSSNGKMQEADMVIGWVKGDKTYLEDRVVRNYIPYLDAHQDYELLSGWQSDEFTNICFRRNLSTCDNEDFEIKNGTMRLLWAFSDKDPNDDTNEIPNFPGDTGSRSYFMLNAAFPKPQGADTQYMDILMPNIHLPNNTQTMYGCGAVKIPTLSTRHHLLGYEINFQSGHKHLLHHMLLYECNEKATELIEKELAANPNGNFCGNKYDLRSSNKCQTLIVWVVGSEGEFYPPETGHVLFNPQGNQYFIIENHYHNEAITPGIIDHTGFRLYFTNKLRKYDAGVLFVGMNDIIIPPKQNQFVGMAVCKPECTEKNLPPTGIEIFGAILHSHYTTVAMAFRVIRNGKEIVILDDENWDPSYEQAWFFHKSFTLLPGDIMKVYCFSNTMNRNLTTFNGGGKYAEMCRVFVQYYPKLSFRYCASNLFTPRIHEMLGVQLWSDSGKIKIPASAANKTFYDYLWDYPWKKEEVKNLQRLYFEEPLSCTCSNLNDYAPEHNLYRLPLYLPFQEIKCNKLTNNFAYIK